MAKKQRPAETTRRRNRGTGKYSERSRTNRLGTFCLILQALISIVFMIVIILLDMLPMNYLALVAMILVFLWCIAFTTQAVRKRSGGAGGHHPRCSHAVVQTPRELLRPQPASRPLCSGRRRAGGEIRRLPSRHRARRHTSARRRARSSLQICARAAV